MEHSVLSMMTPLSCTSRCIAMSEDNFTHVDRLVALNRVVKGLVLASKLTPRPASQILMNAVLSIYLGRRRA